MNKTLTVSIASYNVERFLRETLDSLCSPDIIEDIEVIIVNDGSKDSTVSIAREYVKKYPESFILIDKENGGYGSTINSSLSIANGKYFRILDGDDWVDTNEFSLFVKKLKEINTDLVLTDFMWCTFVNSELKEKERITCPYNANEVLQKKEIKSLAMHSTTVKTDILRDGKVKITEHCFYTDFEFILKSLSLSKDFIYLPLCVYQYRVWGSGQSISVEGTLKHYKEYDKIARFALNCAEKDETAMKVVLDNKILATNASILTLSGDYKRYIDFSRGVKESHINLEPYLSKFGRIVYKCPSIFFRLASIIKRKQNNIKPWIAR